MSDRAQFSTEELAAALTELPDEIVDFRPKQVECLQAMLQYSQTFLNMATGGGKTVIYQAYPILISNRQIKFNKEPVFTLVVEPLRSIIVQQASAAHDASCVYMDETTTANDLKEILKSTTLRCLYCCPESIAARSKTIVALLSDKLCLIAVDEAHLITGIESSFRKDFLDMLNYFPRHIKQLYLSGTFLSKELTDLKRAIPTVGNAAEDQYVSTTISDSVDRPNVCYLETHCKFSSSHYMELRWIIDYVQYCVKNNIPEMEMKPIMIYVKTRNQCNDITTFLLKNLDSDCVGKFHSRIGGKEEYRAIFIGEFAKNVSKYIVTVTTSALGAGLHKLNIYFLLLWGFPRKFVDALQMMGRASRDPSLQGVVIAYYFAKEADKLQESCNSFCNLDSCRRKFILSQYDVDCQERGDRLPQGKCCDNCWNLELLPGADERNLRSKITQMLGVGNMPQITGIWHFPNPHKEIVLKISKPRTVTAQRQNEMDGVGKAVGKTLSDIRKRDHATSPLHVIGIYPRQIANIMNATRERLLDKSKFTDLIRLNNVESPYINELYDSVCVYLYANNPLPLVSSSSSSISSSSSSHSLIACSEKKRKVDARAAAAAAWSTRPSRQTQPKKKKKNNTEEE
jgi:superfamily II DNA helicase RecQ